jgi:hypothetical protein
MELARCRITLLKREYDRLFTLQTLVHWLQHVGGAAVDLPVRVRAGAGAAAVQVLRAVPGGVSKSCGGGHSGAVDAAVGQQGGVGGGVWRGVDRGGCARVP